MAYVFTQPSRAELLERVRSKVRSCHYVFCDHFREHVIALVEARLIAQHGSDEEYPAIIDLDAFSAILAGRIVDHADLYEERRWRITVKGPSSEGDPFKVIVHLDYDENEPMQIIDFILSPSRTMEEG